eukprot:TRINITY_DN795_c1_g1_i5.p2 TRINITY_DN795_c1_g1~~TRINITY_DN795_c1_g1_i5.p2  ORF type:complete len:566 (-),score=187.24 TRINITY_DN795_c1_g1_i5:74-1771(-)
MEQVCIFHTSWLCSNREALSVLLAQFASGSASTKKGRMECLLYVVKEGSIATVQEVIAGVLGEILLCTKEPSTKTRQAAFTLLVAMTDRMSYPVTHPEAMLSSILPPSTQKKSTGDDDDDDDDDDYEFEEDDDEDESEEDEDSGDEDMGIKRKGTQKALPSTNQRTTRSSTQVSAKEKRKEGNNLNATSFFLKVVAGLAGSTTHMMSGALTALARLLYEFKERLEVSFVQELISTVAILLSLRSREVIKAALSFVKVSLSVLPPSVIESHLPALINGMLTWGGEGKNQRFRSKVKILLERLIRRFGFDQVVKHVPEQHKRLVVAVKKAAKEKRKQKKTGQQQGDNTQSKGGTWIVEGEGDNPIDFADPRHVRNVVSTNPKNAKKKTGKEGKGGDVVFQTDESGRLIIEEEEEEDSDSEEEEEHNPQQKKGQKRRREELQNTNNNNNRAGGGGGRGGGRDGGSKEKGEKGEKGRPNKRAKGEIEAGYYKAKGQTKGDVKRGRLEPFAYVPLDPRHLNKRRHHQALGSFKNIVSAAEKGSQSGRKALSVKRRKQQQSASQQQQQQQP